MLESPATARLPAARLPAARPPSPVGALLRHWREARHLSQLALATEAGISARHLCFVETGRARPSREMVMYLASALDVPLRERNTLLLAAGFAPVYREASLDDPEVAAVRAALDAILHQQEPYPAVVMNRHWDVLATNAAASRFFGFLFGAGEAVEPANVLRMMFSPRGLRPFVTNWEAAAEALLVRVQREAVGGVPDEGLARLLAEVLAEPGVPVRWQRPSLGAPLVPVVPVSFRKEGRDFHYFSAVTTLGTPQDVILQELRIESFFPLDEATRRNARELAEAEA